MGVANVLQRCLLLLSTLLLVSAFPTPDTSNQLSERSLFGFFDPKEYDLTLVPPNTPFQIAVNFAAPAYPPGTAEAGLSGLQQALPQAVSQAGGASTPLNSTGISVIYTTEPTSSDQSAAYLFSIAQFGASVLLLDELSIVYSSLAQVSRTHNYELIREFVVYHTALFTYAPQARGSLVQQALTTSGSGITLVSTLPKGVSTNSTSALVGDPDD